MKFSATIIMMVGVIMILMSWAVGGVECYHVVKGSHAFETKPFLFSFLGMTGGGLLVQTGSVAQAFKLIRPLLPIIPGGRRKTDPKDDTDTHETAIGD